MKTTIFAFATACAILVASCSSLPSHEAMRSELSGFELPKVPSPSSSMVYVVRPSFMGLAVPFNVYADDVGGGYLQGSTSHESYIYFELPPGEHVIISTVENTDKLRVVTKSGDILFVEQVPTLGVIRAENVLKLLPDEEGRYRVKSLRLGKLAASNGNAPAAPSKEALAGAIDPSEARSFPRGSLGVGFGRATWRGWGPSLISDVDWGGMAKILSLETIVGTIPNWDYSFDSAYSSIVERVLVRPLRLGRNSLYAAGMFGAAAYDEYDGDYEASGYGPIFGAYAGVEFDLRTLGSRMPPITINAEGGYEYKINYSTDYGYPTFGFGAKYWLWF